APSKLRVALQNDGKKKGGITGKMRKTHKRGNGEGSIFQMKDGRWRGSISLGWKEDANGKKVRKKRVITKATRHEVADELKRLLGKQQAGYKIDPTKQTIGRFLAEWLENTVELSVRPKTYRSYEQ